MKKILLSVLAMSLTLVAAAQSQQAGAPIQKPSPSNAIAVPYIDPVTGHQGSNGTVAGNSGLTTLSSGPVKHPSILTAFDIGKTTYDLQSNAGSVAHRVYKNGNTIAAGWTGSTAADASWADRGTFVNYSLDNGSSWGPLPLTRAEAIRTGFGTLDKLGAGECIVSHVPAATNLRFAKRATSGSGAWTESNVPQTITNLMLWPAMATGGSNGLTIHLIGVTNPTNSTPVGTVYKGLNGALLYWRSTDGGTTWDKQNVQLPGSDSTLFTGFSANDYTIDADGDNVAIVAGSLTTDWVLWKSTDNGTTWTKKIIYKFPITKYNGAVNNTDLNGDGITDTLLSTDGDYAVVIDHNGIAHCFAGGMFFWQDTGSTSGYLSLTTNGLFHWSENQPGNMTDLLSYPTCAKAIDFDNDGMVTATGLGRYGNAGLCSQATAGVDANNNIYLAYSAYRENTDDGLGNKYRNVYMKKSVDGGTTWVPNIDGAGGPYNSFNDDFSEEVYPCMAREVDNSCAHLMFAWDDVVGTTTNAATPTYNGNCFIKYDCVDPSTLAIANGVKELPKDATSTVSVSIYPNPSSEFAAIHYSISKTTKIEMNVVNVTGQQVYNKTETLNPGELITVPTSTFSKGVYYVNSRIDGANYTSKLIVE